MISYSFSKSKIQRSHSSPILISFNLLNLGNNVLVGAGAKVLGPFKIGDNSNVAAGSVVLNEIPDNCTAVGSPARVVNQIGKKVDKLDHVHTPDPVSQELCRLKYQIEKLEKKIKELEEQQ